MSLLPRNITPLERNLEKTGDRFNPPALIPSLWNGNTCAPVMLPWLAWALSVDDWDPLWGIERKRAAINESTYIHKHKGTPSAIMRVLAINGHDDAILIERSSYFKYNGKVKYNGTRGYGGPTMWATFKIILQRPISIKNAESLKLAINSVRRNCCHLIKFDYREAAWRYDGSIKYNGTYTYGTVEL